MDNGGIVQNEDVLDGQGGHFREENAPEGVRYRGVDSYEGEGAGQRVGYVVNFDAKVLEILSIASHVFPVQKCSVYIPA